jgi:hypothetical protein
MNFGKVGMFGCIVIGLLALYRAWRWFRSGPVSPDPWDSEISTSLGQDDCVPLCHHCLTPHDDQPNFCPNCGAAVGTYTNLLPFIYLFSIGHTLRVGTGEAFKRSPVTLIGFFLLGLIEYSVFAPFYWFKFWKNVHAGQHSSASTSTPLDISGDNLN